MPELAPVTMATLPASDLDILNPWGLRYHTRNIMLSERIQPDLKLAAALFDSLERATRCEPGIVRDSYGAGEQAAHDIMRAAAETLRLDVSIDAIGMIVRLRQDDLEADVEASGKQRERPARRDPAGRRGGCAQSPF